MTKKPGPAQRRKREYLEDRTPQEDPEPPVTPEQARRELGFNLLPFNGGDWEVQD
jgi:hypothetical protein